MKSEFELIEKLEKILPKVSNRVLVGIGDDAAVVRLKHKNSLMTVDSLVEGIHFDFSFCEPEEVGHKALAVNLSDIAAMGGKPLAAVISLGVPQSIDIKILEKIYRGISKLAQKVSVDVVGGNITLSPGRLFISITLFGECSSRILKRSGALPGDVVFLTGAVGEAAAGLCLLQKNGRGVLKKFPRLCQKYLKPSPRLECGLILSNEPSVHSLIDVSDGLSSELWHLAKASRVKFLIEEKGLPRGEELAEAARKCRKRILEWQLSGGEDYELLGTCASRNWLNIQRKIKNKGFQPHKIGTVLSGKAGVTLMNRTGAQTEIFPTGWNHLRITERD